MLTLSAQQTRALALPDRAARVRVLVDRDGFGSFVDLTTLESRSWIGSVECGDTVDAVCATARVTLRREEFKLSLSALVQGSKLNQVSGVYVPLVSIGRRIRIEATVNAVDTTPNEWTSIFEGAIDEMDLGGNDAVLTLQCRDNAGLLVDTFIEQQIVYGTAYPGTAVETIMQSILDDNLGLGVVTLFVPVSPGFNIIPYIQEKQPVAEALRILAGNFGWLIKYRWDGGTSAWRLTLYDPGRSKVVPDYTFAGSAYYALPQVAVSRQDIRNKVAVTYTDAVTGIRATVLAPDVPSQLKYGVRYMEINEAASSQLDSVGEANTLAAAVLADLKEPNVDQTTDQPFHLPVETGDLYRFSANGVHYDTDQDLAVVGWHHTLSGDRSRTALQLRGKPSGGFTRWLQLEGRDGVSPTADFYAPGTPAAATQTLLNGIVITYDDPLTLSPPVTDWIYSECHVDGPFDAPPGGDFTPSPATLKATGRVTRFEIGNLQSGKYYRAKVIVFDVKLNQSVATTVITQASAFVSPLHVDPAYDKNNLIFNGEFNTWSEGRDRTLVPPDLWHVAEDTSGNGLIEAGEIDDTKWGSSSYPTSWAYFVTSPVQTGTYALKVLRGTTARAIGGISDLVPVPGNAVIRIFYAQQANDLNTNTFCRTTYYAEDKTTVVGGATTNLFTTAIGVWEFSEIIRRTATAARWMQVVIARQPQSAEAVGAFTVFDRVSVTHALPRADVTVDNSVPNGVAVPNATYTTLVYNFERQDILSWNGSQFTVVEPGTYAMFAQAYLLTVAAATSVNAAIFVNGVIRVEGRSFRTAVVQDAPGQVTCTNLLLAAGDVVQFKIRHDHAGGSYGYSDLTKERNFATIVQVA